MNIKPTSLAVLLASALFALPGVSFAASTYVQSNLVSDIPGLAANTDPNLKNPWGVSFSSASPYWVSNQGSATSTLYSGTGAVRALVVSIPSTGSGPAQGPTGQIFNSTTSFISPGTTAPANFIFDTLGGSIVTWNATNGSTAAIAATRAGATYTGLAIGANSVGNFLYAANFGAGKVDVYNSTFAAAALAGSFTDPNLPANYSPYNVQNINGKLYVEYAAVDPVTHREAIAAGNGLVDVFDTNGNLVQRLIANGGALNEPWGITLASANFGSFSNDLLVGNFGDGRVNAFDPNTGAFLGILTDSQGNPLVNSGLWALDFGNTSAGSDPNALYFTAGINNQADGLFGSIAAATPEPGTMALALAGLLGVAGYIRRRAVR